METFYFTYGTEGQPFAGGWTEVEAPDEKTACAVFRIFHPDKTDGLLNCAAVYSEDAFYQTSMPAGNLGYRCRERISVMRAIFV